MPTKLDKSAIIINQSFSEIKNQTNHQQERFSLSKKIINFLWPKYCLGCDKVGNWLCANCLAAIKIQPRACWFCGQKNETGKICPWCRYQEGEHGHQWLVDYLLSAGHYQEPALKSLILAIKYAGLKDGANILGPWLGQYLKNAWSADWLTNNNQWPIITCIPTTKRKLRQRSYNQAKIIAQAVADYFQEPLIDGLIITKKGQGQTGRLVSQRWQKIKKFQWQGPDISGQNIIVIDDVVTTGATINEAARALKAAGAKKVLAASLAKG